MAATLPLAVVQHHRGNNRATADGWERFADHRTRQTDLLLEGTPSGTLAVLGAGNCNDLDLSRLATAFDAIHLVDVDEDTVRRVCARQDVGVAAKLIVRAPLDLSGALNELPRWRGKLLSPTHLAAFSRSAFERVASAVPDRFDTVLSACLLSQIVHSCYVVLGSHPQLSELATILATVHLRALTELARPGGRVLFVTDTVSSDTYPLRELWGREPPLDLLASLDQVGNVLSGTSVSFVRRGLAGEGPRIVGRPRLIEPWLWQMHPDVTMLVYAMVFQRSSG